MKTNSFHALLLLAATALTMLFSCEKTELALDPVSTPNVEDNMFPEPSEEVINGELFIDGISQKEVITDFEIEGARVIDNRLAFDDSDAFMQAVSRLTNYNTESIVAWSEKIGFTSLFTELMRLEERPLSEIEAALKQDLYSDLFYIDEEGDLRFTRNSNGFAPLYNLEGMVQIGDFVGVMAHGLNVWVAPDKVHKLSAAIKNRYIPEDDKDFVLLRQDIFNNNKDWTQAESCPKNSDWISPLRWYAHSTANRRIGVKHELRYQEIHVGGGLFNIFTTYWIYSESKKGANNRYKTNHYLSLNLKYVKLDNGVPGSVQTHQSTDVDTDTKYANHLAFIGIDLGVPWGLYTELVETVPGISGFNGTAASHRGMDGEYVRQDCD